MAAETAAAVFAAAACRCPAGVVGVCGTASAGAAAANVTLLPPADCFCSAPAAEVLAAFIAEDGSEDAEGGDAVAATVVVGRVISVVAATASPLAVPAGSAAESVPALSRAAAASFAA